MTQLVQEMERRNQEISKLESANISLKSNLRKEQVTLTNLKGRQAAGPTITKQEKLIQKIENDITQNNKRIEVLKNAQIHQSV